ncbi:MAG: 1-acyl-sn-glycerol-3-phosphate acyltransferase [Bacteroidetes bacterium]|nr:1-acyl-sn-glycerol-3-phosphate acyltransferase [Bacteroidota bacterium]MBU1717965.1 1-acyl-sn-glycerol-3-phosphate acyltransferase [Bacteroidota bacterium]
MKWIARRYLKYLGWEIKGKLPSDAKKYVLIAAPHTSNLDFLIGRAAFYQLGMKRIRILIKKEMFWFPLGLILRALGALPVDRSNTVSKVRTIKKYFDRHEHFVVLFTPEGTRKLTYHWKKGFYHIAQQAEVPILLSYMDYAKKEGGIGPLITPSGDFKTDMKTIEEFYKDKSARYPENFNLSPENIGKTHG